MTDHDPGDTFTCPDCNAAITVGSNGIEYGHQRGIKDNDRCPRRPDCVDPGQSGPAHTEFRGPDKRNTEWVLERRRNRAVYHVTPTCPNATGEVVEATDEDIDKLDKCQMCSGEYNGPDEQQSFVATLRRTDADSVGGESDV